MLAFLPQLFFAAFNISPQSLNACLCRCFGWARCGRFGSCNFTESHPVFTHPASPQFGSVPPLKYYAK
jgi:hypothetical protein